MARPSEFWRLAKVFLFGFSVASLGINGGLLILDIFLGKPWLNVGLGLVAVLLSFVGVWCLRKGIKPDTYISYREGHLHLIRQAVQQWHEEEKRRGQTEKVNWLKEGF